MPNGKRTYKELRSEEDEMREILRDMKREQRIANSIFLEKLAIRIR
jgi:plasmid stability protein